MAADIIMQIGIFVFLILFLFLMFIFFTTFLSLFVKKEYKKYEPCVSIIVPCYNEEKNITNCLNSIFSLDYPKRKIEIIIINDGSTDNTSNILRNLKKKYRKIRIFNLKRKKSDIGKWHKPFVLNFGVKKSSHEIILTIDADTFIDKNSLKRIVVPLQDKKVGATNGSLLVENKHCFLGVFQNIEYYLLNLSRRSFSNLFGNVVWFFGAFACYRKSAIEKIGYFKGGLMGEDVNTNLSIYRVGYTMKNVHNAFVYTLVPDTIKGLFKQRTRWWLATLDSLKRNKSLFSIKSNASMLFLFFNHYWWTFYSFILFPLLAYQVAYWMPYNNQNFASMFMYLFRWFSLLGPVYVIYKIPVWGVSFYSIFGVVSGIISLFLIIWAMYMFKGKLTLKSMIAIFFYFPYTLLLNAAIIVSVIKKMFLKSE